MKVDARALACDLKGKPLLEEINGAKVQMYLGQHMADALINAQAASEGGKFLTAAESTKRFLLAIKITRAIESGDGIVDLKSDEQELIKKCAPLSFSPLIVGQIVCLLDGDAAEP